MPPLPTASVLKIYGHRPPRLLTRAGVFVLVAALLMVIVPGLPARAAPVGSEWSRAAGVHGAVHFVGQWRDHSGRAAYCTDFERLSPAHAAGYDAGREGGFVRSDGTRLTERENAALSYLLQRWGGTSDDATAASVQLAVWALTSPGMGWDSGGMGRMLQGERLPARIVDRARSMTRTALDEAGPYRVAIDLEDAGAGAPVTAKVTVTGFEGRPVTGLAARAEVDGPFRFDVQSAAWTTGNAPQKLTLARTGLGSGSLRVTVPHTPAAGVKWLIPARDNVQRLLVAAVLEPREAAAAIADLPAFQPAVATRTSVSRTAPGTAVHDVLTVSSAPTTGSGSSPVPWLSVPGSGQPVSVEVTSTLWGPLDRAPALQDEPPAGTPTVGTVTTRVAGPGTYTTEALTVPSAGWYVWTETIAPESALPAEATRYVRGWQSRFGIAEETTFVPWTAHITTELSAPEALIGETVTDSVTMTGFGPAAGPGDRNVVLSMYGPLEERPTLQPDIPAGAPLHSELTVPVENGTQESGDFPAFTAPGCYTVVATYAGDDHTGAFASQFGEPAETVCVETPATTHPPESAAQAGLQEPAATSAGGQEPGPEAPAGRPELARTGMQAEAAAGAALVLLGAGLACLRRGRARNPKPPS